MEIKTSESVKEICMAMAMAQPKFGKATKNARGFNYKYATLEDYADVSKEALKEHDLFVMQFPSFSDGRVCVTTRLFHKSGEFFEATLSIRPKNDTDQEIGKCITYARRYIYSSILGLIGTEADPDEEVPSQKQTEKQSLIDSQKKEKTYTNKEFLKKEMSLQIEKMGINREDNSSVLNQIFSKLLESGIRDPDINFSVKQAFDIAFQRKGN